MKRFSSALDLTQMKVCDHRNIFLQGKTLMCDKRRHKQKVKSRSTDLRSGIWGSWRLDTRIPLSFYWALSHVVRRSIYICLDKKGEARLSLLSCSWLFLLRHRTWHRWTSPLVLFLGDIVRYAHCTQNNMGWQNLMDACVQKNWERFIVCVQFCEAGP